MRRLNLLMSLIGLFVFSLTAISAQEQKIDISNYFDSIEQFNQVADYRSETMIFKLMQFNAPYVGGYGQTYLDKTGNARSDRVTPFARQNRGHTVLTALQIKEIEQRLSDFSSGVVAQDIKPLDGQLYSAFIFNNNQIFLRYNFIGEVPQELQGIIDFLKVEFEKTGKLEHEAFLEEGRRLKEKYGDWLETPGLIRPATGGSLALEKERALVLYSKGVRQLVKNDKPTEIPLYYALVLYPEGRIIGGAGGGRSDDPISANGISWTLSEGYKPEKELLIKYNAINETVEIEKLVYRIAKGNLFVIKMGEDWKPQITQLKIYLDKPTDEKNVIALFRKELNDETLNLR